MMGARLGWLVVLVMALAPARAAADSARLVYERGPGAEACADADAVRAGVAAQLGRDPFGDGPETIVARVDGDGAQLRGRIEIHDADDAVRGGRELTAASCGALLPALELVIALVADAPPPSRAPDPAPALVAPRRLRPPPKPPYFRGRYGAAAMVALQASAAEAAFGLQLQVALVRPRWSLGLDFRGVLPASGAASVGATVETSLAFAILAPCLRHRIVSVCALGAFGIERGSGTGFDQTRTVTAPWIAVGGRLAAEFPIANIMSLQPQVDLLVPLTRTELYAGPVDTGRLIYRTAPVASMLGVALVTYYP